MQHTVTVSCPVHRSFKVQQVAGMFDLSLDKKSQASFTVDLPGLDEEWQIGVIVGPSGSGKSTVARHAYAEDFIASSDWPADQAVIDCFGDCDIRDVTQALTSVGFSSPPSWVKPYHVLSNGEKFRCDLARALIQDRELIAYDEFTSVVDRTVAKIGSAAISKAIRKGRLTRRFVAVTCHYDVLDWLEPDWVLDMATQQTTRRRLRRPTLSLEITPIHRTAWTLFRRHHYLDTSLSACARCFAAFIDDEPVAFSVWLNRLISGKCGQVYGEHRTVVMPDYQGLGIGNKLSEFVASLVRGVGLIPRSTTSHPAMIRYRSASPKWNRLRLGQVAVPGTTGLLRSSHSTGRITAGFEYVGPAAPREIARQYWDAQPAPWLGAELYQQLIELIRSHPGLTLAALSRRIGKGTATAKKQTDLLLAAGLIRAVGNPRGVDRRAFYPV